MRLIKFRGKSSDNVESPISDEIIVEKGQWIYGSLVNDAAPNEDGSTCLIHTKTEYGLQYFYVDPATIGQFTGLLDADGREIYEGDILMVTQGAMVGFRGYVEWRVDFAEWELKSRRSQMAISQHIVNAYGMKIVSNIHDNPKFLEEIK